MTLITFVLFDTLERCNKQSMTYLTVDRIIPEGNA